MTDTKIASPIKIAGVDVQLLVEKMRTWPESFLSHAQISEWLGYPAQSEKGRQRVGSTRNILRSQHGQIWNAERGSGLRRADDVGKIVVAQSYTARAHNACRRGLKTLACVDAAGLEAAERTRFNVALSHLGMLDHLTRPKAAKAIEAQVMAAADKLPLQKTIEAIRDV